MSDTPGTILTNPFVGLRAFEESEDYLFFGRNNQIDELLRKLSDSRFLAVIGSSGSGKSSLVKSGLLPAIYSGFMKVGSNWRVALMRPGENPIGYLTKELSAEGVLHNGIQNTDIPFESIIESGLRRSENGLVQVYKDAHLPANENLLIVVDQFEELFRFSKYETDNKLGRSDAIHFIKILITAAQQPECPIYVLLTMRSDFLGDCAEFRGLPEAINEGQYLVPRMRRDEIREAITGPVSVSSAAISQRLVTRLLNDINNDTDQLPILQHAMMRTWDAWYQRRQPDTLIDFEDYEKIGTMKAALSQHADEAFAELASENEQQICELMFKALTDKAADARGIRRPRSINDLCILTGSEESFVLNVVNVFRKAGRTFLMPPPGVPLTGKSIVDISHESLMRVWQRLVKWTEEEARSGDIYLRLANSAQLKESGQRGLIKNPELELTLRWKEKNNPTAKWAEGYKGDFEKAMAYLEDSRREDAAERKIIADKETTRKRLIRSIIGLLALMVIAAVITAFRLSHLAKIATTQEQLARFQRDEAQRQKDSADVQRREAVRQREKAIYLREVAEQAKHSDSLAKIAAENSYRVALAAKEDALVQRQFAIIQRDSANLLRSQADLQNELTKKQNLKIAAGEYARLIHDGPSDDNNNEKTFYPDNYFLAYRYHFDQLDDSLKKINDPAAYKIYRSIRNKLYYNNELYKRIYEDFENSGPNAIKAIIEENNSIDFNNLKNDSGYISALEAKTGQKFNSYARSESLKSIFCSTNDNLIYVFNEKFERTDIINMGAKVTALDFSDDKNIIYFGTSSGYIGYINYTTDKKNQPIFENKLESAITAIQFFDYRDNPDNINHFLLAAARSSNARVYKLDGSLKPDKLLIGNELPYEKVYGYIDQAFFYKGKIVLKSSKKTVFLWNPFSFELLARLEKEKGFQAGENMYNTEALKIY